MSAKSAKKREDEVNQIHKLARDFEERYGDGGGGPVKYPVFYCNKLLPPSQGSSLLNDRLARTLRAIDACRNDVQANKIVHDIIDPSFNARMLSDAEMKDFLFDRGNYIDEDWALVHRTEQYLYHDNSTRHYYIRHKWNADEKRWDLDAFVEGSKVWESQGEGGHNLPGEDAITRKSLVWTSLPEDAEEAFRILVDNQATTYDDWDDADDAAFPTKIMSWKTQSHRGAFQWVPTIVRCPFDGESNKRKAKFLGSIAGLPDRRFCEGLYLDLESILSHMLRLLAKVPFDENRPIFPHKVLQKGEIQVVVKAQRYVIPPKSSYTGRWHTEGFSENIVAGGVYYIDVDDTIGGDLCFRPAETPDRHYFQNRYTTERQDHVDGESDEDSESEEEREDGDQWWSHYVRDLPVTTGTAAVFSNTIPHRFRTIRNDTDEPQERLFVNFFFVEPDKPLPMTTSNLPGKSLLRRLLGRNGIPDYQIQQSVMNFIEGYDCADPLHRKVVRDRARASMAADRPRWSSLHYGNAGVVRFHDNSARPYEGYPPDVEEHSGCNTSALGSGV